MEVIYDRSGNLIGSVDKVEGNGSGWFGTFLMPNEAEDKEAFFKYKKDAINFVKSENKKIISQKLKGMKLPAQKLKTSKSEISRLNNLVRHLMLQSQDAPKKRVDELRKEINLYRDRIDEIYKKLNQKTMKTPTKKPTAKQLAARKRFATMAKDGTLAEKRAASKKTSLKKPAPKGLVKFAAKTVHIEGIKRDGTLKKGYKYVSGGKIVKIKPTSTKKGLRATDLPSDLCVMKNADGSSTIYGSRGGSNPCPRGGRLMVKKISMQSAALTGAKPKRKRA